MIGAFYGSLVWMACERGSLQVELDCCMTSIQLDATKLKLDKSNFSFQIFLNPILYQLNPKPNQKYYNPNHVFDTKFANTKT